tara:strand:+ start:97 stop:519 length:423 start_codon:yes stop_codon:yes gene_type:complete
MKKIMYTLLYPNHNSSSSINNRKNIMAVSHNVYVSKIKILNDNRNIISNVEFIIESSDDSDSETFQVSKTFFTLDTSGGNTASGFIDYNSLKESDITSWNDEYGVSISSQLDREKEIHENIIGNILNPPTPVVVEKDKPW